MQMMNSERPSAAVTSMYIQWHTKNFGSPDWGWRGERLVAVGVSAASGPISPNQFDCSVHVLLPDVAPP